MKKGAISDLAKIKSIKIELTRFMMSYKFALDELNTKIDILKQEFHYMHDYNPIEHVKSRVKSPDSIVKKVQKRGYELSLTSIKENIKDIAGIRITCSFISDIYELSKMIQSQHDIEVFEIKDYIKNPKPNGYRSLHLLLGVPVFMSDRMENVCVEVQIRTIAMDFWASLEHKIFYKYSQVVPEILTTELHDAAESAAKLDRKMEIIHKEMVKLKDYTNEEDWTEFFINDERFRFPSELLTPLLSMKK